MATEIKPDQEFILIAQDDAEYYKEQASLINFDVLTITILLFIFAMFARSIFKFIIYVIAFVAVYMFLNQGYISL